MNDEISRLKYVVQVLSNHGLKGVLVSYGFAWYVPFFARRAGPVPADLPVRVRMALSELGGAYVKLGQMLSLRPDLIPQEFCDEFSKLLDEMPPVPLSVITSVIENEFKRPVKDIFSTIDPRPLGSASVAQVHKARLKNGQAVAVKVQRPNIVAQFSSDIAIMRIIANRLSKHLRDDVSPNRIVDEFERYTREELNFVTEASHLEQVRDQHPRVVVPKVYWTYTTSRVIVMDYLDGKKVIELKSSDKPHVARALMDALIDQIFRHGTFHADLHPGNVLLLRNGKIGLLDFGIVGHLDERTRKLGLGLYLAILDHNVDQITEVLLSYGASSSKTNLDAFRKSVGDLVNAWWESSPANRRVTHLMHQLFALCAKHAISLPRDVVLLGKGLITAEATARVLDPHFNFVSYSTPKIAALLKEQRAPKKVIERLSKQSLEFGRAVSVLPQHVLAAVDSINEGRLSVVLKDNQFRHLGQDINLSSNRLSFSLVSAALIMASALMIDVGPKVKELSVISLATLSVAALFVFALFISIAREHSPKYDPHSE